MSARLRATIPPALLALVACVQIGLARFTPLTPWKGGGFGMFATADGASNRTTQRARDRTRALGGARGASLAGAGRGRL